MPLNQHDLAFLEGRTVEGAVFGYLRGGVWAVCKYLVLGVICGGENLSGSGCDLTLSRLRIRGECLCSPY